MRTKNELYQEALRTVARRRQTARAKAEDARAEAEAAVPGLRHAEEEVRVFEMYEVGSVCTKKICSHNFTQFLQFSIIFNIRIPCMDNDFSIIYLGIHNILQKHFHMASSGLHHHVFFIRLIFRVFFNASDCTFHNFLKFFI